MDVFLSLLSGFCWIIVYIQMIRLGLRDRTYGMPVFPLALNIAWETIYAFISLMDNPIGAQSLVILVWLLLDSVVVYTYLKYGRRYFKANQKYFFPWSSLIFLMAFVLQYSFIVEFGSLSILYSAFIQNLIMSAAYIYMLYDRRNTEGQSMTIAFMKWIGTLVVTIVFGIISPNQLILILGIFCSLFDIIYIIALKFALRESSNRANPRRD